MSVQAERRPDYAARHLRIGWWALFVFGAFGLLLETFHGFKVAAYLDVSNDTRRLMWRLAHTHGTLLGIVNLLFAFQVRGTADAVPNERLISTTLIAATVLLPGGFFLGGINFYGGDPGLGVLLVPIGAALLLASLFLLARGAVSTRSAAKPGRVRDR